jgi:hypothetical protein
MSTRVVVRFVFVVFVVFAALVLAATMPLAAQEQAAPAEPAAEGEGEGEADLSALVKKVEKLTADNQAVAADVEAVPYPFGRYVAAAAPRPQPSGDKKPIVETPVEPQSVELPDIVITGKMKMGKKWKLFIDRGSYGAGDSVRGARIVNITDDSVVFEYGGQNFTKPLP